jgi:hypothetical protein
VSFRSRGIDDALRHFLQARDCAIREKAMGDELARFAVAVAEEARAHWKQSEELLDGALAYARELAHFVSVEDASERWPKGLHAAIIEAIEKRDEQLTSISEKS